MSDEVLYKWLEANGEPAHGGCGKWPLPNGNGEPGDWLEVEGDLVECVNGLHLCREKGLIKWIAQTLWIAECEGDRLDCQDKIIVRKARLVEKVETWNDRTARLFVCDCAEKAMVVSGYSDPRSVRAIEVARAVANGEASEEHLGTARDAAWSAAGSAAGEDAKAASWSAAMAVSWSPAGAASLSVAGAAQEAVLAISGPAWAAAGDVMRQWQTNRLLEYLNGERG